MVEDQDVELHDEEGAPFLQQHLSDLAFKQDADDEDKPVNIRIESPSMNKLENAELAVNEKRYSDLQDNVKNYVRKNSILKEAQNL